MGQISRKNTKAEEFSDKELLSGCISGDPKFQKALYEKYASKLFGVCLRFGRDESEAEDIFQESFIKVYKGLKNFRGESKLSTWMHTVFVNTALKYLKKQRSWLEFREPDDHVLQDVEGDQIVIKEDTSLIKEHELIEMIEELPTGYRAVFNMYALEGFTHKEISEHLEISINTSKSQLFRARQLLQKMINARITKD